MTEEQQTEPRKPTDPTPRVVALRAILEWDRSKTRFMESILAEALERYPLSSTSDRAFCTQLCYGVVRQRNTLQYLSQFLSHRPLGDYHRLLRAALSLGLYQAVYLGTPDHALVDATINAWNTLMKRDLSPAMLEEGRGFLNALLRRVCRDGERLPLEGAAIDARDCLRTSDGWFRLKKLELPSRKEHFARQLGIKFSHPPEMIRVWLSRYSEEALIRMLDANNTNPQLNLVLRRHVSVDNALRKFAATDTEAHPSAHDPQLLRLPQSRQVERLPGYSSGDFWIQDATARRLTLMLPQREGASLLDLCAAPGGKLITLLDRQKYASVVACDISEDKLRRVGENLERLGLSEGIEVLEVEEDPERVRIPRKFDQIIVDAPCSNTGVLSRRHEARWRYLPENLREHQRLQIALLRLAVRHLAPGGDLLYATCSIEPSENADVVHGVLRAFPEMQLVSEVEVLPGDDPEEPGDGGYGALLKRRS